jgi:signal transduction histidine kinase
MDKNSIHNDLEKSFGDFTASVENIEKAYSRLWRQIQEFKNKESLSSKNLEEMAGNLAHGIRNPLGGIANFVSLLSSEIPSKQSEKIQRILEGVERIDKIVESLIFFSRPITPELIKCNFVDIVKGAIENVKEKDILADSKYFFSFQSPEGELYILMDPYLIKQALQNILQNSVEAMPEGGTIKILVTEHRKVKRLKVRIEDEGEGLVDGDAEKPFCPFYTTKVYGMGLGLPSARMIVERHRGRIWLNERRGAGVAVVFYLPIMES